jgi:hypothetical protein
LKEELGWGRDEGTELLASWRRWLAWGGDPAPGAAGGGHGKHGALASSVGADAQEPRWRRQGSFDGHSW